MDEILNEKIFLELEDETVEGTIISVDSQNNSFTLNKVTHYPSGVKQDELCSNTLNDKQYILKYEKNSVLGHGKGHLEKRISKFNFQSLERRIPDEVLTADEFDTLIEMAQGSVFIDSLNSDFYSAIEAIKSESEIGIDAKVFIDSLNSDFYSAIEAIKCESEIGIDAKGLGLGNNMKLLNISTSNCIYHFDILKLGMHGFSEGLQSVMEEKVTKVIHDCRMMSYYLNKTFSVNLKNVFDTAVGEFMVTKNFSGEFPKFVCNLPYCIKKFLGIPPALVWFGIHDKSIWANRPLSQSLKFAAARDAVFLLPLKNCLLSKMLSPLNQGIYIFLDLVRNSSHEDSVSHNGTDYLVPKKFEELNIPSEL